MQSAQTCNYGKLTDCSVMPARPFPREKGTQSPYPRERTTHAPRISGIWRVKFAARAALKSKKATLTQHANEIRFMITPHRLRS
jgi:hypothetical protein